MMRLLSHSLNRKTWFNQQNGVLYSYPSAPAPASQMTMYGSVWFQMLPFLTWFLDRGLTLN